jgi:hypothetical protein
MLIRRIKVLTSVMVVFLAGFYSQAIPVNDHSERSISSPQSSDSDQDDQSAATDDSDSSDDFQSLHCPIIGFPTCFALLVSLSDETILRPWNPFTTAMLESDHLHLRL